MPIEVEVNLAIPRIKNPILGENGYPIDNGTVRFTKMIHVPAIPQPGSRAAAVDQRRPRVRVHGDAGRVERGTIAVRRVVQVFQSIDSRPTNAPRCFSDAEWKMKQLLE